MASEHDPFIEDLTGFMGNRYFFPHQTRWFSSAMFMSLWFFQYSVRFTRFVLLLEHSNAPPRRFLLSVQWQCGAATLPWEGQCRVNRWLARFRMLADSFHLLSFDMFWGELKGDNQDFWRPSDSELRAQHPRLWSCSRQLSQEEPVRIIPAPGLLVLFPLDMVTRF